MSEAETITAHEMTERRQPVVLQVVPRLVTGGVERGTIDLATALMRQGWHAIVASEGGAMVRELDRAGVEHVVLPLASKNPITMRRNVGRLENLIRVRGVDIVHARSRAPAWSALAASRRTNAHFVTTFHNAYGTDGFLKQRYNAVMAQGERIIAISEFVARHIIETYRVEPSRIEVIPRGIDMARFDPENIAPDRFVPLARKWNLRDGVPVVLLPGRLTRWKGQLVLIEALRRLGRSNVQCVIVGDGNDKYRAELERDIKRRPLPCAIGIITDCRDIAAAYMLADVVVSASTSPEGFGRVVVEAQAMGRPVIATAHGGSLETIVPGGTGWLVPPNDAVAMAAALGQALDLTPDARLDLAQRAIEHVCANFTVERMTGHTIALYETLLGIAAPAEPAIAL